MRLTHALRATLPPGATTGDARAEPAGIVTDLYAWPGTDRASNWSTVVP